MNNSREIERLFIQSRLRHLRLSFILPMFIIGLAGGAYIEIARGFGRDGWLPYGLALSVAGFTVLGWLVYRALRWLRLPHYRRQAATRYRGTLRCQRCRAALGVEDTPAVGRACTRCEAAFVQLTGSTDHRAWFAGAFFVPWFAFALLAGDILERYPRSGGYRHITTGLPIVDAAIMTLVVSIVLGGATVEARQRIRRHHFMRAR